MRLRNNSRAPNSKGDSLTQKRQWIAFCDFLQYKSRCLWSIHGQRLQFVFFHIFHSFSLPSEVLRQIPAYEHAPSYNHLLSFGDNQYAIGGNGIGNNGKSQSATNDIISPPECHNFLVLLARGHYTCGRCCSSGKHTCSFTGKCGFYGRY